LNTNKKSTNSPRGDEEYPHLHLLINITIRANSTYIIVAVIAGKYVPTQWHPLLNNRMERRAQEWKEWRDNEQ